APPTSFSRKAQLRSIPFDRVAVNDAAAIGADIDASEDARIARDAPELAAIFVAVVVHPHPPPPRIVRAEHAAHLVAPRDREQRGVIFAAGGLAERQRLDAETGLHLGE